MYPPAPRCRRRPPTARRSLPGCSLCPHFARSTLEILNKTTIPINSRALSGYYFAAPRQWPSAARSEPINTPRFGGLASLAHVNVVKIWAESGQAERIKMTTLEAHSTAKSARRTQRATRVAFPIAGISMAACAPRVPYATARAVLSFGAVLPRVAVRSRLMTC